MSPCSVLHPRKGIKYWLHRTRAYRNENSGYYLYWFSPIEEGAIELPVGYEISYNWKTKQPIVRKSRKLT